jgi:outer membrane protein assembly factor BamB
MRQAVLLTAVFTASACSAGQQGTEPSSPRFEIDRKAGQVIRRDPDGRIRWSNPLRGDLGSPTDAPPFWDAKRVYVPHNNGVTALAATTGVVLWHSDGPKTHLMASGDLLLATEHADHARWLNGRAVLTGAEVFRLRLPAGTVAGLPLGEDRVFLNDREVVRLSPDGKARWATPLSQREWGAEGGLVEVGGGNLVAFLYCGIADSGVQLVRVNAATGKAAWRARCNPLGVDHSKYRHTATATVEGGRLRVTSVGSSGTFIEVLDMGTGKRLERSTSYR